MLQAILLVLHVIVAIALITLILLQQGRGASMGAAFGSGASGTVFGARGSASFLSRTTSILAVVFFLNCLVLAFLGTHRSAPTSVLDHLRDDAIPMSTNGDAPPVTPLAPPNAADDRVPPPPPSTPAAGGAATDVPAIPTSPQTSP